MSNYEQWAVLWGQEIADELKRQVETEQQDLKERLTELNIALDGFETSDPGAPEPEIDETEPLRTKIYNFMLGFPAGVADIARSLGRTQKDIYTWFATTGKRSENYEKVCPGVWKLKPV
jgi:hypothetical protein